MPESRQNKPKLNPYNILNILYHIPNFIKLLYRLFKDPRVSFFPKLILVGAIIYFISPYDLLPDYLIPFLGFVEDLVIMFLVLRVFIKYSPEEVVWEHIRAIELVDRRPRF
jgi:uncharacterized membrane protein YkvA (DUF1232 family)